MFPPLNCLSGQSQVSVYSPSNLSAPEKCHSPFMLTGADSMKHLAIGKCRGKHIFLMDRFGVYRPKKALRPVLPPPLVPRNPPMEHSTDIFLCHHQPRRSPKIMTFVSADVARDPRGLVPSGTPKKIQITTLHPRSLSSCFSDSSQA